jgi:hypothetical protein
VKFLANNIEISYNESGQQKITLSLTAKHDISDLKALCANEKLLAVDISQQRKKRSLDANSYFWQLLTQIADVLRTNKEELYIEMLKRYGQREKQLISVVSEGAEIIYRATQNHCCEVGESELNGKTFKHLAILIGSSQYDTKQMSILIDGIVSEAKELDIETMTPAQLQELKSSWKGVENEKDKNRTV